MSSLLKELYKEHKDLKTQIESLKISLGKVEDLINHYGGEVPDNQVPDILNIMGEDLSKDYPINGTWREKIVFVLNELIFPSTAKDIGYRLNSYEKSINDETDEAHVYSISSQYTSNMASNDELKVDRVAGQRNKYSLK